MESNNDYTLPSRNGTPRSRRRSPLSPPAPSCVDPASSSPLSHQARHRTHTECSLPTSCTIKNIQNPSGTKKQKERGTRKWNLLSSSGSEKKIKSFFEKKKRASSVDKPRAADAMGKQKCEARPPRAHAYDYGGDTKNTSGAQTKGQGKCPMSNARRTSEGPQNYEDRTPKFGPRETPVYTAFTQNAIAGSQEKKDISSGFRDKGFNYGVNVLIYRDGWQPYSMARIIISQQNNTSSQEQDEGSLGAWDKLWIVVAWDRLKKVSNKLKKKMPCSLIFYATFVGITTYYFIRNIYPSSHRLSLGIVNLFIERETADKVMNYKFKFSEIKSDKQVWAYLQKTFVPGILTLRENNILKKDDNHYVGLPRMRLVNVKAHTCDHQAYFGLHRFFQECYGPYTSENEVEPRTRTKKGVYKSEKQLKGVPYEGTLATYSGGGYVTVLDLRLQSSLRFIEMARANGWLTRGSRALFVDFTLYNGNVNLFILFKIVIERASTGALYPSYRLNIVDLYSHVINDDGAASFLLTFICIYLIYFILEMMYNIAFKYKIAYFTHIVGITDIAIIWLLIHTLVVGNNFASLARSRMLVEPWNPILFHDFDEVADLNEKYTMTSSLLVLVIWIKMVKFMTITYSMSALIAAVDRSKSELFAAMCIFFLVVISFAIWGKLLFGQQCSDFSTLEMALVSLAKTLLGRFNFKEITFSKTSFATLYIFLYIITVYLLLTCMLVIILTDSYSKVLSGTKRFRAWSITTFIRELFRSHDEVKCWRSALRHEGLDPSAIAGILNKYQLPACEKAETEAVKRIIFEERAIFQGSGREPLILRLEIEDVKDRIMKIELLIQYMVAMVDDFIFKMELYAEAWAEGLARAPPSPKRLKRQARSEMKITMQKMWKQFNQEI